jgi:hypothetical protein
MYNVCSISLTLTPSTISAFKLVHRVVELVLIGARLALVVNDNYPSPNEALVTVL